MIVKFLRIIILWRVETVWAVIVVRSVVIWAVVVWSDVVVVLAVGERELSVHVVVAWCCCNQLPIEKVFGL